jgi:hypothetical protein
MVKVLSTRRWSVSLALIMAGKTTLVISVSVAWAKSTTSGVAPFFSIWVADCKRLEIALDLSSFWFTCCGFKPCIKEVSSLIACAESTSGAKRNIVTTISRQNEI